MKFHVKCTFAHHMFCEYFIDKLIELNAKRINRMFRNISLWAGSVRAQVMRNGSVRSGSSMTQWWTLNKETSSLQQFDLWLKSENQDHWRKLFYCIVIYLTISFITVILRSNQPWNLMCSAPVRFILVRCIYVTLSNRCAFWIWPFGILCGMEMSK